MARQIEELGDRLVAAGFTLEQSNRLESNLNFESHFKNKTASAIKEKINSISKIYGVKNSVVRKMLVSFPTFANFDHDRVISKATKVYGSKPQVIAAILKHPSFISLDHNRVVAAAADIYGGKPLVKKIILKFPPFASYNHARVIRDVVGIYGNEPAVKKAILSWPQFAGFDHSRVIADANKIYGNSDKVKRAILAFPPFAGLDHERVIRQATQVYGNEEAVKKAILSFPAFASYDHRKVMRKLTKIGKLVGFPKGEISGKVLKFPALASYSSRRYFAGIDAARELERMGLDGNGSALRIALSNVNLSPYVPNTNRLRISKAKKLGKFAEPKFMMQLRRSLVREIDRQKVK
ncbi:hypothetical protein HY989_00295 [Candidatus Micrarchaeota archaeon]|nr:hypothetical protein [Candidatus Micrarchaeota archaeon]